MRIVVAHAPEPGVRGAAQEGAEALADDLRERGHQVELVAVPFRPGADARAQAAAWRLLDLSMAGGRTVDLLVAAGFPSYFARHPHKVAWLLDAQGVPPDLVELDTRMRGECARILTAPMYDPQLADQLLG